MSQRYLQVFLLSLILTACKNNPKEEVSPLEFETISVVKKAGEGCISDDFDCSIISLEIPEATGPKAVSQKINAQLKAHVFSLANSEEPYKVLTYEEFAKEFIANHKKVKEKFGKSMPWKAMVTGQVISEREQLLSISVFSEVYTGGAHGYSSISFFNFNPETGERYTHSDLFTEDFVEYAEAAFRERYDIPEDDPINSTGYWFEEERFSLPINIGIDTENVILIYNSYEIASYADGDFRLEFPLEEVAPYLKIEFE